MVHDVCVDATGVNATDDENDIVFGGLMLIGLDDAFSSRCLVSKVVLDFGAPGWLVEWASLVAAVQGHRFCGAHQRGAGFRHAGSQ